MEKSSPTSQTPPCECEKQKEKRQNTLNNLLRDSAFKGHIINVKKWIKAGAEFDVNENDELIDLDLLVSDNKHLINTDTRKVFTALHSVIMGGVLGGHLGEKTRGHYEVAEFLLKKGANPNSEFKTISKQGKFVKFTPALLAIYRNNISILKLLITYGADLNYKNYVEEDPRFEGQGLLYQAIILKHFETVEFLVEKGIDIKYADRYGRTPLHYAVKECDFKIVKLLLANGADLNAMAFEGYNKTPIQAAVYGGNLKMVKLLIEHGADINSKKELEKELSPLHIAVYNKNYEIVEFLLENGADVNQRHYDQDKGISTTPLHLACRNGGHNNIAEILMKYGADIDAMELQNWTPLHHAACGGLHLIVRNLLKKGIHILIFFYQIESLDKPQQM